MQSQVPNQGKSQISFPDPSQARQQLLPQIIHNTIENAGVQGATLSSAMPSVTSRPQSSMSNTADQSSNMPSGMIQNSAGNSVGQGVPSNAIPTSQGYILGSQDPQRAVSQQQPQQSLNSQQFPHQILKQKQQPSPMQSHIQQEPQQQQHSLLQQTQLQSSQQSLMQISSGFQSSKPTLQQTQTSAMQSASPSGLQQNQHSAVSQTISSVLQQHQQLVLRQHQQAQQSVQQQTPVLPQQQTSTSQQSVLPSQQHHQQINATNLNLHLQKLGQQNSMSELQQQQQQLLGTETQSGIPNMQPHQQPMHINVQQQQNPNLLQIQGQHEQSQPAQQQLMSQHQSQPTQMQQQFPQQPNPLQRDMQQRIQTSGSSMLNPQNVMGQKQEFHSQRALPEASSNSTAQTGHNAVDWQEEVYLKIKSMREMYLTDLSEMHQKISLKCQQYESLSQPSKSEQINRLKMIKDELYKLVVFLNMSKNDIMPGYKEKLDYYENLILNYLNAKRTQRPVISQQQIRPPGDHPLSMQQQQHQQQQQSQIPELQQHDHKMNSQIQSAILQNSVSSMQSTSVTGMNHGARPSLSNHLGVSTVQTSMMNSLQPGSTLESGQGNTSSSLQQVRVGSLQQSSVNAPHQANVNTMSESGLNGLQPNINSQQINPNMIQHPHLKQPLQQKRQMHQQLSNQKQQQILQQQHPQQKQQLQQFAHQPQKLQQSSQLQAHPMPQLHQMNEDLKVRQGMGFKPGMSATGLRTLYNHQLKAGTFFPISSPQLLQVAPPQISQHSSPQIDQQSLLPSLIKTGTPLQSADSPFIVPSPSTPLVPSPVPGDLERQPSGVSSFSNAGNIGQPQNTAALAEVQSLAIGTPGISASSMLAEFTGPDGNQVTASTNIKSSVTEQPFERLIKAVKSASPKALSAAVSDMWSVISMTDRIAGSAPGNGSRAVVGEDLAAMTKCRMHATNFKTQDGNSATKKMERHTSAMPLDAMSSAGSVNDSFKHLIGLESSDLESTVTSRMKRTRAEANNVLLEEIRELNQHLIDTVVDISDEDVHLTAAAGAQGGEGTVVKCSYTAVSLSSDLKSHYNSAQMSPILPLRLLVPTNYPNCSPILLDEFPVIMSTVTEDLSVKTKLRFSIAICSLSQPMSLKEIVRTWDKCVRDVIIEYAQQRGGGTFSSRYGTWKYCGSG